MVLSCHDDACLNHISQFSNVAWPVVIEKLRHHLPINREDPLAHLLRKLLEELTGKKRDVLLSLPEWRNNKIQHTQSIEEILSKPPRLHHLSKILVGGRHNATVDFLNPHVADRLDLTFLDDPEQSGLHLRTDVADFVEEDGPPMSNLKQSLFCVIRTRKGPFDVPEQFALKEVLRGRPTVHSHKILVLPLSLIVDHPRHEFFPGSAFSLDQNSRIALDYPFENA